MNGNDWAVLFTAGHDDGSANDNGSFDVLLQLTFPIVLILAFVALVLRQELQQVQTTPVAQVQRQVEELVIELQRQLLTKAIDETIENEVHMSGLDDYGSQHPSPDAVVAGLLDEKYRATSARLYDRFNRPERALIPELRRQTLDRYWTLANSNYPSLVGRAISKTNEAHLDTTLEGGVRQLVDRMVAVQQQLVLEWIRSDAAGVLTRTQSRAWWTRFVRQQDEVEESAYRERFTNVKLESLRDTMIRLRAPLLDRTLQGVL